jgi:VIT1/CCC1 family predicted Fe2+/Mn2+ transporter
VAVLEVNEGLVSVASLVVDLAASGVSTSTVVTGGLAGLCAGAMSRLLRKRPASSPSSPFQAALASAAGFLDGGVVSFLGLQSQPRLCN